MINRQYDIQKIKKLIEVFPVTAILGARQCGKTTLSRELKADTYFDLENPRDLQILANPQVTLESLSGLVVIDEIQRKPELFALLRYLVDTYPQTRYVILGSASRELIVQSSETLAGRIGHYYLGGLRLTDVGAENMRRLWVQGALPLNPQAMAAVERNSYSYYLDQVVEAASADYPDWSVRQCQKQAERIMNAGDAGHYDDAVNWLRRAKEIYLQHQQADEWTAYLDDVLKKHARKYKLVPMLRKL